MVDRGRWRIEKAARPERFAAVSAALYRADPMGIAFGVNPDEYDPEAGTILPRLDGCSSLDDVRRVLREELSAWFGAAMVREGPRLDRAAQALFELVRRN